MLRQMELPLTFILSPRGLIVTHKWGLWTRGVTGDEEPRGQP